MPKRALLPLLLSIAFAAAAFGQCTTQFSTYPAPASSLANVTLILKHTEIVPPLTTATINGNTITVIDSINTEGPPFSTGQLPTPFCGSSFVTIRPLAPGNYSVHWQLFDSGSLSADLGTFSLAVTDTPPPPVLPLFGRTALVLLCTVLAAAGALALRR